MSILSTVCQKVNKTIKRFPALKDFLVDVAHQKHAVIHLVASINEKVISPRTEKLTIAITSHCNLRCRACMYERGFMDGHVLSFDKVRQILKDGKKAGIKIVRLYGGEPLLHKNLPEMVEYSTKLGLKTYITTNGLLLDKKIDILYRKGLREITIGFYGVGADYDVYCQRKGAFDQLERSLDYVRKRYGSEIGIQMNYLVMKPTCNVDALQRAWAFAQKYRMVLRTDLIHYSLPYFKQGEDAPLQLGKAEKDNIYRFTEKLLKIKRQYPQLVVESAMSIRSIPDWLLKGPHMKIPCDAYKLLWIGADGTVKLCYVTYLLGNVNSERLADIINSEKHRKAALDAFLLRCPNCYCERNSRILKHFPSRWKYRR